MNARKSILYTVAITIGIALISLSFTNIAKAIWMQSPPQPKATEVVIRTIEPGDTIELGQAADDTGIYVAVESGTEEAPAVEAPPRKEDGKENPTPERAVDGIAINHMPDRLEGDPNHPAIPVRIEISKIELDAEIIPASSELVSLAGKEYIRWLAPDEAAVGWHATSALLGQPGNTVLNGHHNVFGSIFARLYELQAGDVITVYSEDRAYYYVVANVMILAEKYEDIYVRTSNAAWIQPSTDERLTMITCWPPESNTHRVIVVAVPLR